MNQNIFTRNYFPQWRGVLQHDFYYEVSAVSNIFNIIKSQLSRLNKYKINILKLNIQYSFIIVDIT